MSLPPSLSWTVTAVTGWFWSLVVTTRRPTACAEAEKEILASAASQNRRNITFRLTIEREKKHFNMKSFFRFESYTSLQETRFTSNSRNPLRNDVSSIAAFSRPPRYSVYGTLSRALGWRDTSVSPAGSDEMSATSVAAV